MTTLNDLVLAWMPNLITKHGFVLHEIGPDEVLILNRHCMLLIFRDREGISVSRVVSKAGGMWDYVLGQYLITKQRPAGVVAASGVLIEDAGVANVIGELRWYDHTLAVCAADMLAGSIDWLSEYSGKPVALAEPTVIKIREALRQHSQRPPT